MSTDINFLNFPINSQMWEETRVGWGEGGTGEAGEKRAGSRRKMQNTNFQRNTYKTRTQNVIGPILKWYYDENRIFPI